MASQDIDAMRLPGNLLPIAHLPQFCLYRLKPSAERPGKIDKIPGRFNTGENGSTMNPTHWSTYAGAAAHLDKADGIGLVFTAADDLFFIDIDHCLSDGAWSPLALKIIAMFPGAYVEVSRSGEGLHVIGRGAQISHSCKNKLGLELYTSGRFCALNPTTGIGNPDTRHDAALAAFVAEYMPPLEYEEREPWRDQAVPEYTGPDDDDALIALMLKSKKGANATFDGKASIHDIWSWNEPVLFETYGADGKIDLSRLDSALAFHLAFWTGKNHARIDRLAHHWVGWREKWDRPDYNHSTISAAVDACKDVYGKLPPAPPPKPVPVDQWVPAPPGAKGPKYQTGIVDVSQYGAYFDGCTYVASHESVMTADGIMRKQKTFDIMFGGPLFGIDLAFQKSTRSPWDAFKTNEHWRMPFADRTCFRPHLPPRILISEEDETLVNTYVPITVRSVAGDATPFVDHIKKMLPEGDDAELLISYMASAVQNPGVKFQWWPVLQGTEGNAKTMLLTAMTHAIGRRYVHLVNPDAMLRTGNQFNGWIENKLFLGFEEIKTNETRDTVEMLKATITNTRISSERKGAMQETVDNCANGLCLTNHQDGVPIDADTRRFAIFWTAQQSSADLERDGMTGDYFPQLYGWANGGGWAVITHFLQTYPLRAEMDPARGLHRAPQTSSTAGAIEKSFGVAEQEVLEAIDAGRVGFRGGMISSIQLSTLLVEIKRKIPPRKMRAFMQRLGYDWHPALTSGRLNNPLPGEQHKPTLYFRKGHAALALTEGAAIVKAYTEAQHAPLAAEGAVLPFTQGVIR